MRTSLEEKLAKRRESRPAAPKKKPIRRDQLAAYLGIPEPSYCESLDGSKIPIQDSSLVGSAQSEVASLSTRHDGTEDYTCSLTFDKEAMDALTYPTEERNRESLDVSNVPAQASSLIESVQNEAMDLSTHDDAMEESAHIQQQRPPVINIMETPKSTRQKRSSCYPEPMEVDPTPTPPPRTRAGSAVARSTMLLPHFMSPTISSQARSKVATPPSLFANKMKFSLAETSSPVHARVGNFSDEAVSLEEPESIRNEGAFENVMDDATTAFDEINHWELSQNARVEPSLASDKSGYVDNALISHRSFSHGSIMNENILSEHVSDDGTASGNNDMITGSEDDETSEINATQNISSMSIVKLVAALPSKPKKTAYFLPKPKLIKPESPLPETQGLRRSTRTRVRTLRNDLNERPIYEMDENGFQRLVGVSAAVITNPRAQKYLVADFEQQNERERQFKRAQRKRKQFAMLQKEHLEF